MAGEMTVLGGSGIIPVAATYVRIYRLLLLSSLRQDFRSGYEIYTIHPKKPRSRDCYGEKYCCMSHYKPEAARARKHVPYVPH